VWVVIEFGCFSRSTSNFEKRIGWVSPNGLPAVLAGLLVELGDENEPREPSHAPVELDTAAPVPSSPAPSNKPNWGLAVGVPYTIAVTHERPILEHMAFEAHAGTILAVTSVGARMIVGQTSRSGFYGYGGGGLWLSPVLGEAYAREEGGDVSGVYPYAWTGVGGQVVTKDLQLFGEAGLMFSTDEIASGAIPTIAGGIRL
jgi:hypothetical protein